MIYRIVCSGWDNNPSFLWAAEVPGDWSVLRGPEITNRRARFYFTEKGWRLIGRFLADAARRDGRVVRVLRRKNPSRSEVVYKDELQLAVLPRKGTARKARAPHRTKTPNYDA
ncbi:MAG TPA: hypothetical protein PLU30_06920 [Verrucomicrobiae bacterium]|nr:hypothetical protein [Verrucomicrobiae bacterium]